MNRYSRRLSRRRFIQGSLAGAGLLAGTTSLLTAAGLAKPKTAGESNPFAYETEHLGRVDPSLIKYRRVKAFRIPREEPKRLALAPDDTLYLAAGKYITAIAPDGAVLNEIATAAPVRALAIAGDGLIYASLRQQIEVYSSKSQKLGTWETAGPRAWITGLAVGESDVYAADAGSRVLLRYDRVGKLVRRIGEKDAQRNIPGFVIPSAYFDVQLAKDGLLRVTNPGRHRVEAYTPEGDLEFAWGKASAAIDGFCGCCNPISLALLPEGRCITCEKGLPRVKVFSAAGSLESVVATPASFAENARASRGITAADSTIGGLDAVVDSRGKVYVLDLVTGQIQVFEPKEGSTAA